MNRPGKLWSMWALAAALLWTGACQPPAKPVAKKADDAATMRIDSPAAQRVTRCRIDSGHARRRQGQSRGQA